MSFSLPLCFLLLGLIATTSLRGFSAAGNGTNLSGQDTSKSDISKQNGSRPNMADQNAAKPNPAKLDVLRELSTSFEEISQRSGKAVVQIFVRSYVAGENANTPGDVLTAQNSSGSGIIMSADGYVLTNAHVVRNAHTIRVQLNIRTQMEGKETGDRSLNRPIPARLVGLDHDTDLALLKIEKSNLPFLDFGDSNALKQGQLVLALGNPLGLDNSVSLGVVSAVARQVKPEDPISYIQTDAPINPGNSGGPLIDAEGRVVGVNTFILTQSGGSEGIGFAIPSVVTREVFNQLKQQGHVHRSQLGLVGQTINPEIAEGLDLPVGHGVIVSDVEESGAADHAGIKTEDIIVSLNGLRIDTIHELESAVFRLRPGTKLTLTVRRDEQQLDLPIVTEEKSGAQLDAMADAVDPLKNVVPQLGIVALDLSKDVAQLIPDLKRPAGVVVAARRDSGSPLSVQLEPGDAIYSVNRTVINSVDQLRVVLNGFKSGNSVVLLVERSGRLIYVPFELN